MTNREFVIWLSGFFELLENTPSITKNQLFVINNHLNLAEAVEGGLGEFNLELRDIFKSELTRLEQSSPEDTIDEDITSLLKDKVLTKIKEF
jgi:hypothetical protein